MNNFKLRLFIFVCLFLSGLSAKADFNFKCLGLTKESDCLKQFRERDTLGFFNPDGTSDRTLNQTPSAFCGVTAANTSCAMEGGSNLFVCAVKTNNCSPVSSVLQSSPPQFVCEKGSGYRGVITKRINKDSYGNENVLTEFFCVPKNVNTQRPRGNTGANTTTTNGPVCGGKPEPRVCNGSCYQNYDCNNGKWEKSGREDCEICGANAEPEAPTEI